MVKYQIIKRFYASVKIGASEAILILNYLSQMGYFRNVYLIKQITGMSGRRNRSSQSDIHS